MTVTDSDVGKEVKVVRDLEFEEKPSTSEWIGREGILLRVHDSTFYIVKFSSEQMPPNMNIENNEAWFSDVELEIVSTKEICNE